MPNIKGLHHVSIKTKGAEQFSKTVQFYRDLLGLPVIRQWQNGDTLGAMITAGNTIIELGSNAGDVEHSVSAIRYIALGVDSVDECVDLVSNAGYEIIIQPKNVAIPSDPVYRVRIAFCIGAAGEEIEFFEEL